MNTSLYYLLVAGQEYAMECLARHDEALGRTITKNKRVAEQIEDDIQQYEKAITNMKKSNNDCTAYNE